MRRSCACVLASIAALAFVHSPTARAAGPVNFTVPFDEVSAFDACDFPVESHTTGAVRVHDFLDDEANLVREIANYSLKITYTNTLNGKSVTSRSAGPDTLNVNSDGSATLFSIGLLARIVVPGQGLLAIGAGKLTLFFTDPDDEDPDVLFEAGPHDQDTVVEAAICQAIG